MAESESNSNLAAPGDGDVERLLREAESLTQEVARETGTPIRDADALLSGELSPAPDALAAVDAAAASVMSLEDLLGELGPGETCSGVPASTQRAANVQSPPGLANPRAGDVGSRPQPGAIKSSSVEAAASARGPRVEHMPVDESAAAPHAAEGGSVELNAADESAASIKPAIGPPEPFARRMLAGGKCAARGIKTVILLIVRDAPVGVLRFVDLPFRSTPHSIKNAIGIIGAITLVMGALAWALPGMMRPSPPAAQGADTSNGH